MLIRQENEHDYPTIYDLIRTAFETAKVKDGTEQDYAEGLRQSTKYIPELALVAEQDGKLIGHIMLTKTHVDTANNGFEGLLLAPVSVLLEFRNRGVGSKLITESMERAGKLGYKAVFLTGDGNYYRRFGFVPARQFGIGCPQLPEDLNDHIMARELVPGVLENVSGVLDLLDGCDVDIESMREQIRQKG